jgi:hypothetical protein
VLCESITRGQPPAESSFILRSKAAAKPPARPVRKRIIESDSDLDGSDSSGNQIQHFEESGSNGDVRRNTRQQANAKKSSISHPSAGVGSDNGQSGGMQVPKLLDGVLCCQQSRHKSRQCVLCRYVLCRWFTLLQEQLSNASRVGCPKTQSGPTVVAQSTLKSVAVDTSNDQVVNACSKMRAKFIVTFWCRAQNSRLMHQVAALTQTVVFFAVLVLKMLHQQQRLVRSRFGSAHVLITVCFVDTCVCALRQHVHSLFLVQAEEPLGASSVAKVPSKSPSASSASESESQQVWQRPCVCYVVLR